MGSCVNEKNTISMKTIPCNEQVDINIDAEKSNLLTLNGSEWTDW